MTRKLLKTVSLILCLIVCVCLIPACQKKVDPLAKSGFQSLTLDKKGRVNATVTLDAAQVEAHSGEKAYLYEVAPGKNISEATRSEPLDETKVASTLSFKFSLTEDGNTRLYSSFVVGFEDGSTISSDGFWIQNPELLAADSTAFSWANSPKAIAPDDVDQAVSMGAMHAMYEVRFSELLNGSEVVTFNGASYTVSADVLSALDKQIRKASSAGMQVSLTVIPDLLPSADTAAALIDHLAARYTKGDNGSVTALFVGTADGCSAAEAALLGRFCSQALRSRIANGRVYIACGAETLIETKTFFSDVLLSLNAGGTMEWGAAVTPVISDKPVWETDDGENLTLQNLSELWSFLLNNTTRGRASRFAVVGLSFPAADLDAQAVSYAYAYRAALSAGASLIVYNDHIDDGSGLISESGDVRRIADMFSAVDVGLSDEAEQLCTSLAGNAWSNLSTPTQISRKLLTGISNAGTLDLEQDALFDFTTGNTFDFSGVNSLTAPVSHDSAAWQAPVLYTWLDPNASTASGVQKVLSDGSLFEDGSSVTIHLLTQATATETCTVRLTLEGVSENGTRLTYSSDVKIQNGQWQVITCQIGSFVAAADLSGPCVLTLTAAPDDETDEPFVLWIKNINVRRPADSSPFLPLVLIFGGAVLTFAVFFVLYRLSVAKRRRR